MSQKLAPITASTIPAQGQNIPFGVNTAGAIAIYNDSQVVFKVTTVAGDDEYLYSKTGDVYEFAPNDEYITVTPLRTITSPAFNADVLDCIVYTLKDISRWKGKFPALLGAQGGVTTVSQVVNDNQPAGTVVVESTASGDTPSDYSQTNDGKVFIKNQLAVGTVGGNNRFVVGSFGAINTINTQQTAGGLGVAAPVSIVSSQHVTVTTLNNYISFTALTTIYRLSAHLDLTGTVPATITLGITYGNTALGGVQTAYFSTDIAGAHTRLNAASIAAVQGINAFPITIWANAGNPITLFYQNATPAVNDFLTVVLERLA